MIRYVLSYTGGIVTALYTFEEIENGALARNLEMIKDRNYAVIRRDKCSFVKDITNTMIFEHDKVFYITNDNPPQVGIGEVTFDNGSFVVKGKHLIEFRSVRCLVETNGWSF